MLQLQSRVAQVGGKSANIILDDANLEESIGQDAFGMCMIQVSPVMLEQGC